MRHGYTVADTPESTLILVGGELLRLNGLAGALVNDVIEVRGDEAARADAGVVTSDSRSAEVTLAMKPELPAGTYVVMGVCEKTPGTFGTMYNTQVFISPTHDECAVSLAEDLLEHHDFTETFELAGSHDVHRLIEHDFLSRS